MNYAIVDTLYLSRETLLNHLKSNGYNTTPFTRIGPKEILQMLNAGEKAFLMDLERDVKEGSGEPTKCRVIYTIAKIKQRLPTFLAKLTDQEEDDPYLVDPETTEVIVMTVIEPIVEAFHKAALDQWNRHKLRIRFFQAAALVINPLTHMLVPPHEKVPAEEIQPILTKLYCTSRTKLPLIRFHEDPIARLLGLLPGDVVKITRPSPTALTYDPYYRVCAP